MNNNNISLSLLATSLFTKHQKHGPIRSAQTGTAAVALAKPDQKKLEEHYGTTGQIILASLTLLWGGEADPIFN